VGVATAIARGGEGEVSNAAACSATGGWAGVLRGFGVSSSFRADSDLPVFLAFFAVSFSCDFFFATFGFGVGVCRRFDLGEVVGSGVSRGVADDVVSSVSSDFFPFFDDLAVARFAAGLGVFFGFGEDAAPDSLVSDLSPGFCCSSVTCARRRPVMIAPTARAVASQMRKRTTATERNRARDAINAYSNDLLKKLQRRDELFLFDFATFQLRFHAAAAEASRVRGAALRILSASRRRMAFNLPPSNSSRQVRYIHVSSTTIDASARYVGL